MKRRKFLYFVGGAVSWPLAARAEQPNKVARIGMLWVNSREDEQRIGLVPLLHGALRDLGYVEGENLLVEERFADSEPQRLDKLAAQLAGLDLALIVTGAESTFAARRATKTIPIVTVANGDMVGEGLAASLAHPGGNVTGNDVYIPEIVAKRMEMLMQILPSLRRAVLLQLDLPLYARALELASEVAKARGVALDGFEVSDSATYEKAFAAASAAGAGGMVINDSAQFINDAAILIALANQYRLAAVGPVPLVARGLLSGYGVNYAELFRRAATFVDKILKGAKPGDIPIEQATKFATIVNLKTAAALGLDIPPTLLAAADEVIE